MKFTSLLSVAVFTTVIMIQPAMAADPNFSDMQKTEIQKLVHDYLVSNPEVLLEASQALQQKQQQTMQKQAQSAIKSHAAQIFADKITTVGNPKGPVTLVEFFDYQCSHCKEMASIVDELRKQNPSLRVVYKEFPIFGESSDMASRAALAAGLQNKYLDMHQQLISQKKRLDETIINNAAKAIGLDIAKFKADMANKTISQALDANRKLAEQLHLMGTPAFIIATTPEGIYKPDSQAAFIPGAASRAALQDLIKKAQG